MESCVSLSDLNKWFGSFQVLDSINLSISTGEKVVICGPSGSGKSTLIRCVNALEPFQSGSVNVCGISVEKNGKNATDIQRRVGMVFQQFNLFPHLSVLYNCTLATCRVLGLSVVEAESKAMHYLERVRIPEQALLKVCFKRTAKRRFCSEFIFI